MRMFTIGLLLGMLGSPAATRAQVPGHEPGPQHAGLMRFEGECEAHTKYYGYDVVHAQHGDSAQRSSKPLDIGAAIIYNH